MYESKYKHEHIIEITFASMKFTKESRNAEAVNCIFFD